MHQRGQAEPGEAAQWVDPPGLHLVQPSSRRDPRHCANRESFMARQLYERVGDDPARWFSPYCWRLRMALAHKGLVAEVVPWRFTKGAAGLCGDRKGAGAAAPLGELERLCQES